MGTGVSLPPNAPPPDSTPPLPSETDSERMTAVLRENSKLREGMRRYHAILEERRLRSIAPQGPEHKIPRWAMGLAYLLTAFAGAGGFKLLEQAWSKPTAAPADIQRVEKECRERIEPIVEYLAAQADDEQRRNEIHNTVLCALNGGSPGRGIRCPEDACATRALTPEGKIVPGQPICKAVQPWPARRRPPKPKETDSE